MREEIIKSQTNIVNTNEGPCDAWSLFSIGISCAILKIVSFERRKHDFIYHRHYGRRLHRRRNDVPCSDQS